MGWQLPFLESNLVQISEDEFQLTEPGGWRRIFRRAGKGSDELDGGTGWKGVLTPDHATLWSSCGWRLDFRKGKIVQMQTPHSQTISYNYTNGRISSIMCGMKALISVDPADAADHTLGIVIDGKGYAISKVDQPRIQRISGLNVIVGNDPSFSCFLSREKLTRTFTYTVDDQTLPVMHMTTVANEDTAISWDPYSRRITKYGNWTYNVRPNDTALTNATITRTNINGQTEYWKYDGPNGKEVTTSTNGITTTRQWFVTGVLARKNRLSVSTRDGRVVRSEQWSYDEKGRILRSIIRSQGKEILRSYSYDNNGKCEKNSEMGSLWKLIFMGLMAY